MKGLLLIAALASAIGLSSFLGTRKSEFKPLFEPAGATAQMKTATTMRPLHLKARTARAVTPREQPQFQRRRVAGREPAIQ